MRFIKIYSTLFFIFSICFVSNAQLSGVVPYEFDRLYRLQPNRAMFGQSVHQLSNDNYVTLSTVDTMFTGDAVITQANITTFTNKGNVIASFDYSFEDTLDLYPVGNVLSTEDRYFFCTATKVDTNSVTDSIHTNIVVALDRRGNPVWSKKFGSGIQGNPNLLGRVDIISPNDSTLILMGIAFTDTTSAMLLSSIRMDNGDMIWSKTMNLPNTSVFSEARNMTLSKDSTLIITGSAQNFDDFYISEIDPVFGEVIWSESYDASGGFLSDDYSFIVNDIAIGNDSSLVATGIVTNTNINLNEGYVASFDKVGNFQWAQIFNLGAGTISNGLTLDVLISGNIAVMVGGQNNDAGIFFPTQIILNPAGGIVAANDYSIFLNSTGNNAELIATSDRGSIFMGSGIEHGIDVPQGTPVGFFYPRLIKTDENGVTTCENEIMPALDPLFLEADTLIWESENAGQSDSIGISVVLYNGFLAPILSIPDTSFCPGDPVMYLMDATTRGATSYRWTKADDPNTLLSADSTFVGTELDVQYIATVYIEEDLCFQLCDTIILTEIPMPAVTLAVIPDRFCEEGLFEVQAEVQGVSIERIEWSTGTVDDGKRTLVTPDLGTYSITVTNMCDDIAIASVSITEADQPPPIELIISTPDPCDTPGDVSLTIANDNISNVNWSTGESGNSIIVTEAGTYSVSATDICGYEVSDDITLTEDSFWEPLEIGIISDNCDNDQVDLTLDIISGTATSISWSSVDDNQNRNTLQGDDQIGVPADVTYEVLVQDQCQNTVIASISDPCQCLKFPNAFFPGSMDDDDINKNFGPVNSCSNISNYNLKVFNRWGQKVFESSQIEDEWNGENGGTELRGDVYVYVASYETEGGEFKVKGDVTLLK